MRTHAVTLSLCSVLLCALLLPSATSHAPTTRGERRASRRHWLQTAAVGAGLGAAVPARALDALPATVRKYTALAPLGSATATVGGTKRICLSEVLPECDSRVLHSTAAAHAIDATYHSGACRCSPRHSLEI